jgi:hypothetical protein
MRLFFAMGLQYPLFTQSFRELVAMGHECVGYMWNKTSATSPMADIPAKVVLENDLLFHQEDLPKAFAGIEPAVLSKRELDYLSQTLSDACLILDRSLLYSRTNRQMRHHFWEAARYTLGMFRKYPIDAVVCSNRPHFFWPFVCQSVAKMLGIPVKFYHYTSFGSVMIHEEYSDNLTVKPDETFQPETMTGEEYSFIESVYGNSYVNSPATNKHFDDSLAQQQYGAMRDAYETVRYFAKKSWQSFWLSDQQLKEYGPGALRLKRGSWMRTRLYVSFVKMHFYQRHLNRTYAHLMKQPNLAAPYVYFPLHLQPELSTLPWAGAFDDQFLAANILSHALPDGWRLYIKENSVQLRKYWLRLDLPKGREVRNYEELAALPNVTLLPADMPSKQLIAGAKLCATVNGTAAWEAVCMGKPSLVFAPHFSAASAGCAMVSSVEDAREAILRLTAMEEKQIKCHTTQLLMGMRKDPRIRFNVPFAVRKPEPEETVMYGKILATLMHESLLGNSSSVQ